MDQDNQNEMPLLRLYRPFNDEGFNLSDLVMPKPKPKPTFAQLLIATGSVGVGISTAPGPQNISRFGAIDRPRHVTLLSRLGNIFQRIESFVPRTIEPIDPVVPIASHPPVVTAATASMPHHPSFIPYPHHPQPTFALFYGQSVISPNYHQQYSEILRASSQQQFYPFQPHPQLPRFHPSGLGHHVLQPMPTPTQTPMANCINTLPLREACIKLPVNNSRYWGMDYDRMGRKVYVTDKQFNQVILADLETSRIVGRIGVGYPEMGGFHGLLRPCGITVDCFRNRLLVVDKDHQRISTFSMDGHYICSFGARGHGKGQFDYPWDVEVSPNGNMLAVTDSRNHRIQIYDAYGNYIKHFSAFEADSFKYKKYLDYPRGVTFDSEGKNIFVTDFKRNTVVKFDFDTLSCSSIVPPRGVRRPQGIIRDYDGNLLLVDSRNGSLRVIDTDGTLVDSMDNVGPNPTDVCKIDMGKTAVLTSDGKIFVL